MNPGPEPGDPLNSDLQLVERTLAGDQRAYEMLVIKYQRRIERLIGRMVRDVDLIPDIAQETFLRAWRFMERYEGRGDKTWLMRIALNGLLIDALSASADEKGGRVAKSIAVSKKPVRCSSSRLATRLLAAMR